MPSPAIPGFSSLPSKSLTCCGGVYGLELRILGYNLQFGSSGFGFGVQNLGTEPSTLRNSKQLQLPRGSLRT